MAVALRAAPPLLRAKLLPPLLGSQQLVRERLDRRLDDGSERRRVTVVSGGPGYGKTSLVVRHLRDRDVDTVWYRLDARDHDPWLFYRYLVEGFRGVAPEFGEASEGFVEELRARKDEVEKLADVLVRDAEMLNGRVHLVLDRVEYLEQDTACARLLRRVVEYLPDTIHVILVGRSLPDVGISALVASGAGLLLQTDDLSFTDDETHRLLNDVFGLDVDRPQSDRIHDRTRGWVTALQLLRQSAHLHGAVELPVDVFGRAQQEIFDYFSEEVYSAESAELRGFLVSTAIPAEIDPDLVAAALEQADAADVLRTIRRRGLFVSALESSKELYTYDPLFREFLLRKLRAERGAEGERQLHLRYGRAHCVRLEFVAALRHLVAAGAVEALIDVLGREGRALLRIGFHEEVTDAASFIVRSSAGSAIAHDLLGEARRLAGDHGAAVGHFEKALATRQPATLAGEARAAALQGQAYSLLKLDQGDRAAAAAQDALREVPGGSPALVARILNTLSIIHYQRGRHPEAIEGWGRALAAARQGEDEHLTLMVAHNLGLPHAVTGDYRRASECFRMLTSQKNRRLGPEEAAAHLNLARISIVTGHFDEAASRLDDAREIARRLDLRALSGDVLEAEGNLLRETGRLDEAAAKYAAARTVFTALGLQEVLDNLAEEEAILAALRGEFGRAEQLAGELAERARAAGEVERTGCALLVQGEVRVRAGENEAAALPLEEAVTILHGARRAYEECVGRLWLALCRLRLGAAASSAREVEAAVRLAASNGYGATLRRLASLDSALRSAVAMWPEGRALLEAETLPVGRVSGTPLGDRADLTIHLLGTFEVYRDAQRRIPPGAWKLKKASRLFCYIAAARSHRATKERLVEAVWGHASASVVRKNFHPVISMLRRALNHGHQVPKSFVIYEAGSYRLNPSYRYEIDAEVFEKTVLEARRAVSADREGALAGYDRALALYRGPLLDGVDDEWIEPLRFHCAALYEAALAEAAEIDSGAGRIDAAVDRLMRLVDVAPLDEGASVRLMRALGAGGRRGEVEREFQRLETALEDVLRVAPAAETRRAYREAVGRSRKA